MPFCDINKSSSKFDIHICHKATGLAKSTSELRLVPLPLKPDHTYG